MNLSQGRLRNLYVLCWSFSFTYLMLCLVFFLIIFSLLRVIVSSFVALLRVVSSVIS